MSPEERAVLDSLRACRPISGSILGPALVAGSPITEIPPVDIVTEFSAVLANRRSGRNLSGAPSARVVLAMLRGAFSRSGGRRPYAASGSLDEHHVLLQVNRADDFEPGFYWLANDGLRLYWLGDDHRLRGHATREIRSALGGVEAPAVALHFLAHWSSIAERYDGCTLATALINAGAIIQVAYQVAYAVGLECCAATIGADHELLAAIGLSRNEWGRTACLAMGLPRDGRESDV
jgi:SagB-type dehydrogenase family enzyme